MCAFSFFENNLGQALAAKNGENGVTKRALSSRFLSILVSCQTLRECCTLELVEKIGASVTILI